MSHFMTALARAMATLGGIILTALIILVCVSVFGRGGNTFAHWDWLEQTAPGLSQAILGTGIGPLNGDFELVEAGIAFAIFSFLPLCQIFRGHATVDVFTSQLSARFNFWLMAFWEVVLTAIILLITWRLGVGLLDKMSNGETTLILQFPVWWAYAASMVASLVASLVAVYCAAMRVAEAVQQKHLMPGGEGAIH